MTTLPSYLSSGASSRAHHAFLVKLHRAQSDQEEDEVIQQEVERARRDFGVKGGASLSAIVETLIILLHCTIQQHRSGIFETKDQPESGLSGKSGGKRDQQGAEDWALMAALQVVERAKDIREKRIGYLYLAERLPKGHELGLMLINTIRKDLESKDPAHVLLALRMIVKLPSVDLAPAVTPLLISKYFLKYSNPAIRQCSLQGLMALYLSINQPSAEPFPLSMGKVVSMLSSEKDNGVLCVLCRLLRTLIDTGAHKVQSSQEQIYLVQQLSSILAELPAGSQVALEAVRSLHVVLGYRVEAITGGDSTLAGPAGELDEILDEILSRLTDYTGLNGAFIYETCQLFSIDLKSEITLPSTLQRCLAIFSTILSPPSSSSMSTLPAANDHIFVLRCLAKIPLNQWDQAFGADEMGIIMQGLESGDDSVRKATLRLIDISAPQVLIQTLENYTSSLSRRSDLVLPPSVPAGSVPLLKVRMGMYETATRALEVVFVRAAGKDDGGEMAKRVRDVLKASEGMSDDGQNLEVGNISSIWDDGCNLVLSFLGDQSTNFQQTFAKCLIRLPVIGSPSLIYLHASLACKYHDKLDVEGSVEVLLADLDIATGGAIQETILAAIVLISSQLEGDSQIRQRISQVLEGMLGQKEEREISKRVRNHIEMILECLKSGLLPGIKGYDVQDVLRASQDVLSQHNDSQALSRLAIDADDHVPAPRSTNSDGGKLRYGAYDPPTPRGHRAKSSQR